MTRLIVVLMMIGRKSKVMQNMRNYTRKTLCDSDANDHFPSVHSRLAWFMHHSRYEVHTKLCATLCALCFIFIFKIL